MIFEFILNHLLDILFLILVVWGAWYFYLWYQDRIKRGKEEQFEKVKVFLPERIENPT